VKKSFILCLIVLLAEIHTMAQNPFIRHFTTKDGLPTNTLYQMIQDKNKFIWISSDAGVIKYDGSVFTNYRKKDGLSSNEIVRVNEDNTGRIWLSNYNAAIDFIEDGKIHNSKNTQFLNDLRGKSFILDIFTDNHGSISFYNYLGEVFNLSKQNHVTSIDLKKLFNSRNNYTVQNLKISRISYFNNKSLLVFCNKGTIIMGLPPDKSMQRLDSLYIINTFSTYDNEIIAVTISGNYILNNGVIIKKIEFEHDPFKTKAILKDHNGNYWLTVEGEGVYCIRNGATRLILNLNDAHGLLEDHEHNIWVSTSSNGLFQINHDVLNYTTISNEELCTSKIKQIITDKDERVWMSTDREVILKSGIQYYSFELPEKEKSIEYIFPFQNKLFIKIKENQMYAYDFDEIDYKQNKLILKNKKGLNLHVKNFLVSPDNKHFVVYDLNSINFSNSLLPHGNLTSINLNEHINYAFFNADSKLIVSTTKNQILENGQLVPYKAFERLNGSVINNHLILSSTCELIIADGDSLFVTSGNKITNITKLFAVPFNNQIKKAVFYKSNLFLATCNDVFVCRNILDAIDKEYRDKIEVDAIPVSFDNIKDMLIQNDSMYIVTNDRLIIIPVKIFLDTKSTPPIPYLVSIAINDSITPVNGNIMKLNGEKKLEITIGAINYYSGILIYSYMMEGSDRGWNIYTGNRFNPVYQNLPPGTYNFKVRVRKTNSGWSEPLILTVVIKPTLFQNWLFRSFILLMLIGAVTLFFYLRRTRKMKKIQDKMQLLMMEQKALQAMMNPHFIFNSLGSIQNYLLQNKNSDAVIYLSDLAKHIRHNLDSIKTSFVLLDDEVDRLVNYLNLEKTRLDGRFEFDIQIDEGFDEDTVYIPGMMVQPFVENAIWHGIATLPEGGKIQIRFDRINSRSLLIIIQDNGIGLKEGLVNTEKSSHKSGLGISITRKRLQLLGKKFGVETGIIISDADQEVSNPGTRIELKVPYTNKLTD
jgi:two-component sensor histidine kinase